MIIINDYMIKLNNTNDKIINKWMKNQWMNEHECMVALLKQNTQFAFEDPQILHCVSAK